MQTLELRHSKAACRGCRAQLEAAGLRHFYEGDDADEARRVALKVSAQNGGLGIEEYAEILAVIERERVGTVAQVVEALGRRSEFGVAEVEAEMRRLHVAGDPERLVEGLLLENRLYEPRSGRYRFV